VSSEHVSDAFSCFYGSAIGFQDHEELLPPRVYILDDIANEIIERRPYRMDAGQNVTVENVPDTAKASCKFVLDITLRRMRQISGTTVRVAVRAGRVASPR